MASGTIKNPVLITRRLYNTAFTTTGTRGAFIKYDAFGDISVDGYVIISVQITSWRNPGSYIAVPCVQNGTNLYCEYYTSNVNVSIVAKDAEFTVFYLRL